MTPVAALTFVEGMWKPSWSILGWLEGVVVTTAVEDVPAISLCVPEEVDGEDNGFDATSVGFDEIGEF